MVYTPVTKRTGTKELDRPVDKKEVYEVLDRVPIGSFLTVLFNTGEIVDGIYLGVNRYERDRLQLYMKLEKTDSGLNRTRIYPLSLVSCIAHEDLGDE